MRKGHIGSARLVCLSCDYRSFLAARIPVLLPPGETAVYRHPFLRTVGTRWREVLAAEGPDSLAARCLRSQDAREYNGETLPEKKFRRAIYRGSNYYIEKHILPGEVIPPEAEAAMGRLVEMTIRSAPRRILDISGHDGVFFARLHAWRPSGGISVAMRRDFEDIKVLEGRVRLARANAVAVPVAGDARRMPFPGDYFDVVTSFQGFRAAEGVTAHIGEIHRVLKTGGKFFAAERPGGADFGLDVPPGILLAHALRKRFDLCQGITDLLHRLHAAGFTALSRSRVAAGRSRGFEVFAMEKTGGAPRASSRL